MSLAGINHLEEKAAADPALYLELANPTGKGPSLQFPVLVKSLSAGGVILEAYQPPPVLDAARLQGRQALIRPTPSSNGTPEILGTVQWARLEDSGPDIFLGLELAEPTLEVRRVLEAHLPITTRDLKALWDHWDQMQGVAPTTATTTATATSAQSQSIYLVGLGVVLGGTALQFLGPENLKPFGFILIIYGCLTLAVKSVWTIMRGRVLNPRNRDSMNLTR